MATITFNFDRIGRKHDVQPLVIPDVDLTDDRACDAMDAQVTKYIGKHLASRDFDWFWNTDETTFSIEYGRFGGGTVVVTDP
jgi:hypothetical protein